MVAGVNGCGPQPLAEATVAAGNQHHHHRPDTITDTNTDTEGTTMTTTATAPTTTTDDQLANTKPYEKVTRHTRQPRRLWADACRKAEGEGRGIAAVITALLERYVAGDLD